MFFGISIAINEETIEMLGVSLKKQKEKKTTQQMYYKCERCGYITIVKDSTCPICAKDGFNIKMI